VEDAPTENAVAVEEPKVNGHAEKKEEAQEKRMSVSELSDVNLDGKSHLLGMTAGYLQPHCGAPETVQQSHHFHLPTRNPTNFWSWWPDNTRFASLHRTFEINNTDHTPTTTARNHISRLIDKPLGIALTSHVLTTRTRGQTISTALDDPRLQKSLLVALTGHIWRQESRSSLATEITTDYSRTTEYGGFGRSAGRTIQG
jgi:hypothetical protein